MAKSRTIPDSELDVLRVLWERGEGTVRDLLGPLKSNGRSWSYATVATLLDRLEQKGMVRSDRSELAFVYKPLITAEEVRQQRLGSLVGDDSLVERLYDGEPGLLVLHLIKSYPLSPEHAHQVRTLLSKMGKENQVEDQSDPQSTGEIHS